MQTNKELIIERALEVGFTPAQMNALEIELQEVEKKVTDHGLFVKSLFVNDLIKRDAVLFLTLDWEATPQGHAYWQEIHLQFMLSKPLPDTHPLHISNFEPWEETEGGVPEDYRV